MSPPPRKDETHAALVTQVQEEIRKGLQGFVGCPRNEETQERIQQATCALVERLLPTESSHEEAVPRPEPITSFRGPYFFLSNFFPCAVRFDGDTYPSVEHAYQAAKTLDPKVRAFLAQAPSPGEAKRRGYRLVLRPEWLSLRVPFMRQMLQAKFSDEVLRERLLATGDRPLVEENTWGDLFWGICRGRGENQLGKLLMEVRLELSPVFTKQYAGQFKG